MMDTRLSRLPTGVYRVEVTDGPETLIGYCQSQHEASDEVERLMDLLRQARAARGEGASQ